MTTMTRLGELEPVADGTMAANIEKEGSLTQSAIDARVAPATAAALADPATSTIVSEAVDIRVEEKIDDLDVVGKTDPGVFREYLDTEEDLLVAITDKTGVLTWLSARRSTGGPSAIAEKFLRAMLRIFNLGDGTGPGLLYSVTDANGVPTDLTVRSSDGGVADFVLKRQAPRLAPLLVPFLQGVFSPVGLTVKSDLAVGAHAALAPLLSSIARGAGRYADGVALPANPYNFTSSTEQPSRLTFPTSRTDATPLPLVIVFEGVGAYTGLDVRAGWAGIQNTAGVIYARSAFHGDSYGSAAAMSDAAELYRKALEIAPISHVILVGNSMGGIAAQNALIRGDVPNVTGLYLVDPTYDLRQRYDGGRKDEVTAAYGLAADGSDYTAKTAGYDPALQPASAWRGVPVRIVCSTGDTVVPKTAHADKLATKLATTNDVQLLNTGDVGHNTPARFISADLAAFILKVSGGPIIH
ncbi:alpha/beta fold hydrolase [Rathayibacter sp. Leaf248]|uniref:alpha/beta fold hydrolase n=1 Tax=Rathayibacter sp. Leaf248 TaxID=2876555 RepID=UPI001E28E4E3|nr:alpha/beta hydrolase [Rathayibacter sp. Leaf248]